MSYGPLCTLFDSKCVKRLKYGKWVSKLGIGPQGRELRRFRHAPESLQDWFLLGLLALLRGGGSAANVNIQCLASAKILIEFNDAVFKPSQAHSNHKNNGS